jgi:hypothetical protein
LLDKPSPLVEQGSVEPAIPSLPTIAAQANEEHRLATEAACNALEHACRCGELLNKGRLNSVLSKIGFRRK